MKRLGIHTGADLKARSLDELRAAFGSAEEYYHRVARGIDDRPVRAHRERKSIGAETTFANDTGEFAVPAERLAPLIHKVWTVATVKSVGARTVTLKLQFSNFAQITRARSLGAGVPYQETLADIARGLLRDAFPLRRSAALIRVALSALHLPLEAEPRQLGLGA